ncbi:MAG: glutathione peroxidase [Balneolales bacterium]
MKLLILVLIIMGLSLPSIDNTDIYSYTPNNINGESTPLSTFQGKTLLIVNTASKCGFTPQYEQLQELYEKYSDKGFVVLGFPADNFGGQEPGTNEDIAEFCSLNFGVNFPMFSKLSVKGNDQAPLFTWLTHEDNPDFTGDIDWNFEKFLIDPDGNLKRRFRSKTEPLSDEITNAIENLITD